MEKSTAYLTYKGSISEAIIESQKQKKLFLVFISGEDENSINLENSTWLDDGVATAVSRYCIFLHLIHGHVEASQFSAIYQQKSVPSISAVGYNGVMLWQHEGYINGESFVENIEKAWAAMHFQDTAAVLLSAALASKKSEPSSSCSTDFASVEQGESSNLHDSSSLADNPTLNIQAEPSNDVGLVGQKGEDINKDNNPSKLDTANAATVYMEDNENKENETAEIVHSVTQSMTNLQAVPREHSSDENHPKSSQLNADDEGTRSVCNEVVDRESTMKSTTIHLSIRMPGGNNLQKKFAITDRLTSVKNFVDENHENNLGSYDLAIPYPRKVFGEEDMSKALSDLGFAGRQSLMVIPKSVVSAHQRGPLPSNGIQTDANQTASNGYFGYLKRVLSFMNPFSYLGDNGGPSSSQQAPDDDLRRYHPNPGLQNSLLREENLRNPYSSNPQNTNARIWSSRTTSRPFGSNIHTLRDEEDDFSSRDRNTFWNGNMSSRILRRNTSYGRRVYRCPINRTHDDCKFFRWADDVDLSIPGSDHAWGEVLDRISKKLDHMKKFVQCNMICRGSGSSQRAVDDASIADHDTLGHSAGIKRASEEKTLASRRTKKRADKETFSQLLAVQTETVVALKYLLDRNAPLSMNDCLAKLTSIEDISNEAIIAVLDALNDHENNKSVLLAFEGLQLRHWIEHLVGKHPKFSSYPVWLQN